jgi:large subunit ribosomal protein L29
MISKEIRQRSDEELDSLEKRLRDDLFNAKMQNATGHSDLGKIRNLRKDLARVKTIRKERELKIR